ncbi:hypothetical protein [Turneriella parva]|uniref:Uncharacterized protein n=1 Tax=Turneriella parva (strain ATCC BAA-1111 / DSM 21527 / NCTC 11395 / H) TaxID=869212 RepID=I4B0L0_TURPD|nr:hypothetical protein [Turneriella parva]AFM10817.1 hypothetical protein Turpa_0155 [Turneriella parva DSM 21527]
MRTKTTLELEAPVYRKLKTMASKEGKTLKKLMDELIVLGLRGKEARGKTRFVWPGAVDLEPKIDITDKELVTNILDRQKHVLD